MNGDTVPIRIPRRPSAAGSFAAAKALTAEVEKDLAIWQSRGSDDEKPAADAMGRAIKNARQLIDTARELHSNLVLEDSISVVEFGREPYQIRKGGSV